MHGNREIKLTFVCAAIELVSRERCSNSRLDWGFEGRQDPRECKAKSRKVKGPWSYEAPGGGGDVTGTASRPEETGEECEDQELCCQVGITVSRYQVQSLRTWDVSGIDGNDAGPHGDDEPRRSEAGSTFDAGSPRVGTGLGLTLSSRTLARQRKTEKKGEKDEKR